MPINRVLMDEDSGGIGTTGPNGTGPGNLPALLRNKYLQFTWSHTELLPNGLLKGFRLAVFTGTDPNDTSKYILEPRICDASDTGAIVVVRVSEQTTINAAIQAIYNNGNESSWRDIGGGVVVDPDTVLLGTQAGVDDAAARAAAALLLATQANANMANVASDNILSRDEKSAVIIQFDTLALERCAVWPGGWPNMPVWPITPAGAGLDQQAVSFTCAAVDSAKAEYNNALNSLTSYLYGLN